jgi:segregation and condensation protein B
MTEETPGDLLPPPESDRPDESDASDESATSNLQSEMPPPLPSIIEAVLFAADEPVPITRLAEIAGVTPDEARAATDRLNEEYQSGNRSFRVHRVAQGFQLYTRAEYADWVRRLYSHSSTQRLSKAALEVLAIIAYNQPVTRPDIERLRNVDCSGPLLTLLERRLIATAGRAHRPGNPFLYRTTREFLRYFGLENIEDLPQMEELGEFLAQHQPMEARQGQVFDGLAVDLRPPVGEQAPARPGESAGPGAADQPDEPAPVE